jgi:hypothetical protein
VSDRPRREAVRKLEEENNLLNAKLELVMDMVSHIYKDLIKYSDIGRI